MRKGLLEYFVFVVIKQKKSYGYEILESLKSYTSMHITESAVYPILAKSAREGLMTATKHKSPAGPPRQYYDLTPSGRIWLARMSVFVEELNSDFGEILQWNSRKNCPATCPAIDYSILL